MKFKHRTKLVTVMSVTVSILLFLTSLFYSAVAKGDISIGLNYPGVGIRYFFTNTTSLELKAQSENNVSAVGLRFYRYFGSGSNMCFFWGLEGDYVTFKGTTSEGTWFATEVLVGGEYFFTKNLSFQADIGPAFISLADKNTTESVSGLEYVINFGINYYFGRGGK